MSKCKHCGQEIQWIQVGPRWLPANMDFTKHALTCVIIPPEVREQQKRVRQFAEHEIAVAEFLAKNEPQKRGKKPPNKFRTEVTKKFQATDRSLPEWDGKGAPW